MRRLTMHRCTTRSMLAPMKTGKKRHPAEYLRPTRDYAVGVLAIAAALALGILLRQFLAISNIALMLLIAVQIVAIAYGLGPALLACIVSALGYNFLFIPPLYTFSIADTGNVVTLFFFTIAALITGNLTSRVRERALDARRRAKITEDLYAFSRKLASAVSVDDLLWATAWQIAAMLNLRVLILLPEKDCLTIRAGCPPEDAMDRGDWAAAEWVWRQGGEAGRGTKIMPDAKRLFIAMRTSRGVAGVVGLEHDAPAHILTADRRRLYDALAGQAALALERINLAQDIERVRIEAETEKLRAALLTSISHDLRTPLASILGSATTLRSYRAKLDQTAQEQLIETIKEEAERLNRFISDLLDMTRLEAGAIQLQTEWVDISDVVGSALRRAANILADHKLTTELDAALPLLKLDPVLLEQVLFNLMDNAAKYAPPPAAISLRARRSGALLIIEVIDEGDGIPAADTERIFEKFYRVRAGDRQRAGTGLGLAICRGFINTMGGTIRAGNRLDRKGAVFTIELPLPAELAPAEERAA